MDIVVCKYHPLPTKSALLCCTTSVVIQVPSWDAHPSNPWLPSDVPTLKHPVCVPFAQPFLHKKKEILSVTVNSVRTEGLSARDLARDMVT